MCDQTFVWESQRSLGVSSTLFQKHSSGQVQATQEKRLNHLNTKLFEWVRGFLKIALLSPRELCCCQFVNAAVLDTLCLALLLIFNAIKIPRVNHIFNCSFILLLIALQSSRVLPKKRDCVNKRKIAANCLFIAKNVWQKIRCRLAIQDVVKRSNK